ncbi:MAG: hypothetical protein LBK52_00755, partial [Deltaproteobacteria bacterium]|nr:hypothetical protein [Deltaproteobacteria bacterium]
LSADCRQAFSRLPGGFQQTAILKTAGSSQHPWNSFLTISKPELLGEILNFWSRIIDLKLSFFISAKLQKAFWQT